MAHHEDLARAVKTILEKEFEKPLTIDDLAQRVGSNKSTLNQAFRSVTGMSLKKYQRWYRVENAKKMLATTEHSIDLIAKKMGFNRRNLEKQFKVFTGTTPRNWRIAYEKGEVDFNDPAGSTYRMQ